MPLLLILALPIIEILVALQVAEALGFMNAIGLLCGAALVGLGILSITGRSFLLEIQARAARGEPLENVILSQALRFLAGLLFLIPGFVTDIFAILTLVASIMPRLFAGPLNRNVQRWNSNFVVFTQQGRPQQPNQWRDVTPEDPRIIDVSPEKPGQGD